MASGKATRPAVTGLCSKGLSQEGQRASEGPSGSLSSGLAEWLSKGLQLALQHGPLRRGPGPDSAVSDECGGQRPAPVEAGRCTRPGCAHTCMCVCVFTFIVLLETGLPGTNWELKTQSNNSPACIWPKGHGVAGRKTALLILFGFSKEDGQAGGSFWHWRGDSADRGAALCGAALPPQERSISEGTVTSHLRAHTKNY